MLLPAKRSNENPVQATLDKRFAPTRRSIIVRCILALLSIVAIVVAQLIYRVNIAFLGVAILGLIPSATHFDKVFGTRRTNNAVIWGFALVTCAFGAALLIVGIRSWPEFVISAVLSLVVSAALLGSSLYAFGTLALESHPRALFRQGKPLRTTTARQRANAAHFYASIADEAVRERNISLAQTAWRNLRELVAHHPEEKPVLQMAHTIRNQQAMANELGQTALLEACLQELRDLMAQFPVYEGLANPLSIALAFEAHVRQASGKLADQVPLLEELRALESRYSGVADAYAYTLLDLGYWQRAFGRPDEAREFLWEHQRLYAKHSEEPQQIVYWAEHLARAYDNVSTERNAKLLARIREDMDDLYRQHPKNASVNICYGHCFLTDAYLVSNAETAMESLQAFIKLYRRSEFPKDNDSLLTYYKTVVERWHFTKLNLLLPNSANTAGDGDTVDEQS